ncbi:MAG: Stp1/IreP family PP2C-type Ser/Thr phosphatase [Phascolarctobacterium sp.]|uniref:Stp1/IreP family PP2C-type Ser/Thr phosphatase n=1 Tax=Phascolarctobacterium sp. TaxID=2049039 RepID=UPI0026DC5404|nr:Stp1/IreP family PP2C-type Ser/Thr phosphatase [Phascolarctobacterium sp.]MDO4921963.1 Stp1/IreP family PP2C-type Ser/Thr phosphatase [Phascolarctobacterium sp.]
MMRVVSKTHVGLVRENNEDTLLVREPYLFAVADGMGGYAAGEIASRSTIKAFEAATYSLRHEQEEQNVIKVLQEAFAKANAHVYKMAVSNDKYKGMGTTMTALYLPGNGEAYCCHIGDSRLYLYRNGQLRQVTRDHTFVADLQEQGKITREEAFVHPQRHILLQAMGVDEEIQSDCLHFSVEPSDRLLLCSDGLSDMLRDREIADIIGTEDLQQAADKLLEQSLDNGGRDNVSLILIDLTAQGEEGCNG